MSVYFENNATYRICKFKYWEKMLNLKLFLTKLLQRQNKIDFNTNYFFIIFLFINIIFPGFNVLLRKI